MMKNYLRLASEVALLVGLGLQSDWSRVSPGQLWAVVRALDLPRVVLVGHSMGGAVVQRCVDRCLTAGLALLALAPRLGVERQRAADWRLTLVFSLLGVLVFVPAVLGCSMLSARLFLLLSGAAPEPISHSTLAELVEEPDRASVVIWSVVLVTLVPLGEELIFRVFVQSAVLSVAKSEFVSILLTSVLFAMMHFPVLESASEGAAKFVLLLPLFVLGLGGGWLYERTRSVVAPAGFHGAFNLVNIVIAFGMFGG